MKKLEITPEKVREAAEKYGIEAGEVLKDLFPEAFEKEIIFKVTHLGIIDQDSHDMIIHVVPMRNRVLFDSENYDLTIIPWSEWTSELKITRKQKEAEK